MNEKQKLIIYPNNLLFKKSVEVSAITDKTKETINDMIKVLNQFGGAGLSAVQIGKLKRIVVISCGKYEDAPLVLINPEIKHLSKEKDIFYEGCLSFPGVFDEIERSVSATIKYKDLDFKQQEIILSNEESECVQHEIEHLDGKIFLDHLSRLKRSIHLKRLKKNIKKYIRKQHEEKSLSLY